MARASAKTWTRRLAELLDEEGIRACLEWFSREKQWVNEQHLRLCRVPAPTFQEKQRAEWMAAELALLGCDVQTDRAGNVLARVSGDPKGPFVALTAHLDTVLAPRRPEEITVGADGRFLGPGVGDNGAGLAALLAVAASMQASRAVRSEGAGLLLVANVGEEGEGNLSGMRYLCKQQPTAGRVRAFLVLDGPGTEHITTAALASRRFEVAFDGPGGHSWSDCGVGNPVHALGRAISLFADVSVNGPLRAGGRYSVNFGTVEGGTSVNSIPTEARAKVDIRSESDSRMEELATQLGACVERALESENGRSSTGRITARIREIGTRPGGSLPDDSALIQSLRAVDSHLGIRPRLDCASTDANIPLSLGVEAASIGAGGQGGRAHTPSEWFHPGGRDLGLKRIFLTLGLLLAPPGPGGGTE